MTKSQLLYLAFRYNFHREALERPEVRKLFLENNVPFDAHVVDEWRKNIDEQKTLEEIFTPMPAEALEGRNTSLLKMASRYLFDAPKSASDAAWRITSTIMLATCLVVGYGIVARPALVRDALGLESVRAESVESLLIRILESRGTN